MGRPSPGILLGLLAGVCIAAGVVQAQDNASVTPAPTLQRLSEETQALYDHVRGGVVRIQLPPTHWPAPATDTLIDKWRDRLDPDVLQKLQQEQVRSAAGGNVQLETQIGSATQPTTMPGANVLIAPVAPRLAVNPRPDGGIELGPFSGGSMPYDGQLASLSLRVIGVIMDDAGHVLVPLYIEPGAIGDEPLRCATGDGQKSFVRFVGSDRQTNLTVFKLTQNVGRPVTITAGRPSDGSLVMVLAPGGDAGRLTIWTGGQQDRGIVVTMDGSVAGFARYGQFLNGAYAQPVVDQLIRYGRVRRATLGVLVEETETPDGVRAMRIERVVAGSAAEKAGLHPGDYILAMSGAPVGDLPSFAAAIAAGDGETELELLRGERTVKVTVLLKPH